MAWNHDLGIQWREIVLWESSGEKNVQTVVHYSVLPGNESILEKPGYWKVRLVTFSLSQFIVNLFRLLHRLFCFYNSFRFQFYFLLNLNFITPTSTQMNFVYSSNFHSLFSCTYQFLSHTSCILKKKLRLLKIICTWISN